MVLFAERGSCDVYQPAMCPQGLLLTDDFSREASPDDPGRHHEVSLGLFSCQPGSAAQRNIERGPWFGLTAFSQNPEGHIPAKVKYGRVRRDSWEGLGHLVNVQWGSHMETEETGKTRSSENLWWVSYRREWLLKMTPVQWGWLCRGLLGEVVHQNQILSPSSQPGSGASARGLPSAHLCPRQGQLFGHSGAPPQALTWITGSFSIE